MVPECSMFYNTIEVQLVGHFIFYSTLEEEVEWLEEEAGRMQMFINWLLRKQIQGMWRRRINNQVDWSFSQNLVLHIIYLAIAFEIHWPIMCKLVPT